MIHFKNISKKFADGKTFVPALHDINFKIKEGEFIAIMGPSGSGKTSILNLIGGLDSPTKGSVFIDQKDISKFPDKELSRYRNNSVGFIFQEFNLEPFLTVKQNILLPTFFGKYGKHKEKYAEELISEVGLSDKRNTHANQLSGGQKQRAAVARALINNPQIILADEPTGNLDKETGKKIIELLKSIHEKRKIILIIATHNEEIAKAADRIIHLKEGHIC